MANPQNQKAPLTSGAIVQGETRGSHQEDDDPGTPPPTSPVMHVWQWLKYVRQRTRHSFTPLNPPMPSSSVEEEENEEASCSSDPVKQLKSLWDQLGEAATMDIDIDIEHTTTSTSFHWSRLSSLHHAQHSSSTDRQPDDDTNRAALGVIVNSGGVVFFALFDQPETDDPAVLDKHNNKAAVVIKISSSRMATQSERLGYEFAKRLGIQVPRARVVYNFSPEWLQIKEAAHKAREAAILDKDQVGEVTCSELLEALELSRCIFLMNYVHGSPLMENATVFDSREEAEKIASALGRILVLDLVIRNEDRLCCRQLGWRGNSANLLLADKSVSSNMDKLSDSSTAQCSPSLPRCLHKASRRSTSIAALESQKSDMSEAADSPTSIPTMGIESDIHIVAIDSGVPRRPPAGKLASDQDNYPKLVELILNSNAYSSNLLHEITGGKLGSLSESDASTCALAFRNGFRAAFRDLQGIHIFLLTLHKKLDILVRSYMSILSKFPTGEMDRDELVVPESPMHFANHCASPISREHSAYANNTDSNELDAVKAIAKQYSSLGSSSPPYRDSWQSSRSFKGIGESQRSFRLTAKLRDLHKYAKGDGELSKELDQWTETVRKDVIKLCQDNSFNTGFFEGSDNYIAVDAYELKVRLEHILERISIICDAANTEKPSLITESLFIGGSLAARSVYTLQHLGVAHILCLCTNEIGQSESQYPHLFEYKNFCIRDEEDSNISSIFKDGCDFIDDVEKSGGKVLVHCFEGRSRSATMVLAYLMLRKKLTLLEAWNKLKKVHRRAHPNEGFARILVELDKKLHNGKASMEWQQRKPTMKVCPICGKNAGLSSTSLSLHLHKSHKRFSSGSMDSAMTLEIQKAVTGLSLTC
ncbi:hypothetical protein V2J09_005209 [Rumex salicifolius]